MKLVHLPTSLIQRRTAVHRMRRLLFQRRERQRRGPRPLSSQQLDALLAYANALLRLEREKALANDAYDRACVKRDLACEVYMTSCRLHLRRNSYMNLQYAKLGEQCVR